MVKGERTGLRDGWLRFKVIMLADGGRVKKPLQVSVFSSPKWGDGTVHTPHLSGWEVVLKSGPCRHFTNCKALCLCELFRRQEGGKNS
jgi:hypothetical protein